MKTPPQDITWFKKVLFLVPALTGLLLVTEANSAPDIQKAIPAAGTAPAPASTPANSPADAALSWDAESKEVMAHLGDAEAKFSFWFTNKSSGEVIIQGARSSCFCTVAQLPVQPWKIASGQGGEIKVSINLAGKRGTVGKPVWVETSAGVKVLQAQVRILETVAPAAPAVAASPLDSDRLKNIETARADRQAVFKNQDCARCHAEPARDKTEGKEIYAAVCASCHDSSHRADMVPNLRTLSHPTDAAHWRQWIAHSRPGSVMPAFARSEGGPLHEEQIEALVGYLVATTASVTRPAAPTGLTASTTK